MQCNHEFSVKGDTDNNGHENLMPRLLVDLFQMEETEEKVIDTLINIITKIES